MGLSTVVWLETDAPSVTWLEDEPITWLAQAPAEPNKNASIKRRLNTVEKIMVASLLVNIVALSLNVYRLRQFS